MKHNFVWCAFVVSLSVVSLEAADSITWGDEITLESAHGKKLTMQGKVAHQVGAGKDPIRWRIGRGAIDKQPETFVRFGDHIFLKMDDYYLGSDGYAATGDRKKRGEWEIWQIIDPDFPEKFEKPGSPVTDGSLIALKSATFGKFLVAEDNGWTVRANRNLVSDTHRPGQLRAAAWERWQIRKVK